MSPDSQNVNLSSSASDQLVQICVTHSWWFSHKTAKWFALRNVKLMTSHSMDNALAESYMDSSTPPSYSIVLRFCSNSVNPAFNCVCPLTNSFCTRTSAVEERSGMRTRTTASKPSVGKYSCLKLSPRSNPKTHETTKGS